MTRTIDDIRFDALRNAIYHSSRGGFLNTLNRFLSFVVVVTGAAAVADLGREEWGFPPAAFAAIATVAAALQLVFDFGSRARTHEFLQRRFYEIAADVSEAQSPSEAEIKRWDATLKRLYAEEPPPMRALDAISYNAAVESLGWAKERRLRVSWWQSLFRQVWAFNQAAFDYVGSSKSDKSSPPA